MSQILQFAGLIPLSIADEEGAANSIEITHSSQNEIEILQYFDSILFTLQIRYCKFVQVLVFFFVCVCASQYEGNNLSLIPLHCGFKTMSRSKSYPQDPQ